MHTCTKQANLWTKTIPQEGIFFIAKDTILFVLFFQLRGSSWILGPLLVLVIAGQTVQSQSVEQLLAQAKATESIEDLLADAVVEKKEDVAPPAQGLHNAIKTEHSPPLNLLFTL